MSHPASVYLRKLEHKLSHPPSHRQGCSLLPLACGRESGRGRDLGLEAGRGRIVCLRPERGHKCYFHTISLSSDQTGLRGVGGGSWRQVFALAFKDPRTESASTPARPHLESG